jgi:hypothetical protein
MDPASITVMCWYFVVQIIRPRAGYLGVGRNICADMRPFCLGHSKELCHSSHSLVFSGTKGRTYVWSRGVMGYRVRFCLTM